MPASSATAPRASSACWGRSAPSAPTTTADVPSGPLPRRPDLGLTAGDLTPGATQAVCVAGVVGSFAEAAEDVLPRLAGLTLSESTVQRTTEAAGRQVEGLAGRRAGPSAPSGRGPGTRTPRARPAPMCRSTPRACRSRGPAAPPTTRGWPPWRWSTTRSPRITGGGPSPPATPPVAGPLPGLVAGASGLGEPLRRQAAQVGMDGRSGGSRSPTAGRAWRTGWGRTSAGSMR